MNSKIFSITWSDIKSALVSLFIVGVLAIASYVIQVGDVFALDAKQLINSGVLAVLVAIVSLLKSFFTTKDGKFVGLVSIKK